MDADRVCEGFEDMKHRAHVFLTEPLLQRLRERSAQTGLTMSDLIRRAIEQFLKKEAK